MLGGIFFDSASGNFLEEVRKQLRNTAAVNKHRARIGGHRPVEHVLHPIVRRFHYVRGVFRVVVW